MFEKRKRRIGFHYTAEGMRRVIIRCGIALIAGLVLLCYIEIRKESIVAAWYEETLYRATAQGRWLKYGRFEPETSYQKRLDRIPILHYLRQSVLQSEAEE